MALTHRAATEGKKEEGKRKKELELSRESGVFAFVRFFGGSLIYVRRRRQIEMRSLSVCRSGFDRTSGRTNSLLDFLFSRGQRIVRHVQRAFLYFDFDYTVQRFDRIGYFFVAGGVAELVDFDPSDHRFAQACIGRIRFILHVLKLFRARRADLVYAPRNCHTYWSNRGLLRSQDVHWNG
jgi:hypothetical protein